MSNLNQLLETHIGNRDEAWEKQFLAAVPLAQIKILAPEPREGPDGWPYLMTATEGADDSLANVIGWLAGRGIGLVINPEKSTPDFVFTYGMIWNFRERGEFITQAPKARTGSIELKNGQELLAGPPSEGYLPTYARSILKQFLLDQGIFAPKVLMVSFDKVNYDLCFSIESLKSPPEKEHAGIAEAIGWFLPAHYAVSLVSEKSIPGFAAL